MAGVFGLKKVYTRQRVDNWPESANYGYFGGGSTPTTVNTVDRIDFSNETTSLPESDLTQARWSATTVSNSNYGYFVGGYVSPFYRCTIDRLDFSTEIVAVPPVGNQLTQARYMMSGVSSPDYGYFAGGEAAPYLTYPKVSNIDRLDFSTETMAGPPIHGINLTEPRSYSAGVFNRNYGYFAGDVAEIDRIDFSNDTTSEPGVTLTQSRYSLTSVSASNYGYFAGGNPFVDTIDRIDFSNETTSAPGNDLTQAKRLLGATSNSNYGYFGAGLTPPSVDTIDRIDFSNEIVSLPGNNLPQGRYYVTGVSGGTKINAKGFKKHITDISGNPTSKSYGYFVAGYSFPGYDNDVDRLDFSTGSMSQAGGYPSYIGAMGAVSNLNYGYFAGGEYSGGPTNSAVIRRIDFSNESYSAANNNLPSERDRMGGVSNSNYGYFAGGSPHPGSIDRMDFSNESISSAINSLPTILSGMAVSMTPNYGYFAGGGTPTNNYSALISRIDFSNETVSTPGNNLSEGRSGLGGVTDSNYGYFGAGQKGPPSGPLPRSSKVEKIDFSNETVSSPGNNLSQARIHVAATSDSNYGYFGGGASPHTSARNTVDRIDMSSGTVSPSPGLNKSRYDIASVSN